MPTDSAIASEPAEAVAQATPAADHWAETALTVMFTAAAILFVSFIAVMTGLA